METLLTIFIVVTAVAVVIQMIILAALFFSVKKTSSRIDALAQQMQTMLQESRARWDTVLTNVAESTTLVRQQVERLNATVSDAMDRARLQVIRADELVTRTMDRVEETTDLVHHTVVSPVRQAAGLMKGLTAGIETFFGRGRRRAQEDDMGVSQDELFI